MYLTARLIALSIYCLLLIGFCISITKVKYTRFQLFCYACILALMGFFYVPDRGSDLGRILPLLSGYARLSWKDLLFVAQNQATPMVAIYYHFIGLLHEPRLLPFINAFVTFTFCFSVLSKSTKKYTLPNELIALILFFFMSRGLLMGAIANLRTMLSLAILGYCIYKEMIEGIPMFKYIPLLIIATLFHTTAVAALLIYLVFSTLYDLRFPQKISYFIQHFTITLGGLFFGGYYLQHAFQKGQRYLETSLEGSGYFYIWECVLSITVLIFTFAIISSFLFEKPAFQRQLKSFEKKFIWFVITLVSFDLISFLFEFNIGLRLSWLVTILDMPLLAIILSNKTLSHSKYTIFKYSIVLISVFLLSLACARGHLCSLKFFEYL